MIELTTGVCCDQVQVVWELATIRDTLEPKVVRRQTLRWAGRGGA